MKKYNLAIVSPYPVVCVGLEEILSKEGDLRVKGVANNYKDAMQLVKEPNLDITVTDISLKRWFGDVSLINDIKKQNSSLPILVYSGCDENLYANRCLKQGAKGYIMMDESPKETVKAIRTVLSGKTYLNVSIGSDALIYLRDLTPRELEVFNLVGYGMGNPKISGELGIAMGTLKSHLKSIAIKLKLYRGDLREFAISEIHSPKHKGR